MIYCNIRGLYNFSDLTKPNILYDLSSVHNVDIMCLTETHLNDKISDNELLRQGWEIFRSDRKDRIMGGSAILLKSDYIVTDRMTLSNSFCDTIGIFIHCINNHICITISFSCYQTATVFTPRQSGNN